jgi:hypothetical protein
MRILLPCSETLLLSLLTLDNRTLRKRSLSQARSHHRQRIPDTTIISPSKEPIQCKLNRMTCQGTISKMYMTPHLYLISIRQLASLKKFLIELIKKGISNMQSKPIQLLSIIDYLQMMSMITIYVQLSKGTYYR